MMSRKLVLSFALVPCLLASGFQQVSTVGVHQRLDLKLRSTVTDEQRATSLRSESTDLPPVLQGIVNERAEFQINLGRAMDTLRQDYQTILHRPPGKINAALGMLCESMNLTSARSRLWHLP